MDWDKSCKGVFFDSKIVVRKNKFFLEIVKVDKIVLKKY